MRIIFIEFLWQVREILKDKKKFENDVIISLRDEVSYLLVCNKIRYFETYEICKHEELWEKYNDITKHSLKIAKLLDDTLWNIDERFKKLKWNFFNDYHYILKASYDQFYYYSELIYQITKKYNPSEIWVANSNEVVIDSKCLIHSKISILKFLLKSIEDKNRKIVINYMSNMNKEKISYQLYKIFVNKLKYFINKKNIEKKIYNFSLNVNFLFNYYFSKPKYISVGCHEISIFKKLYPSDSNKFLSYRYENLNDKKLKKNWILFERFINHLKNNTNFKELVTHRGISSELIFSKILLKLTRRLDFFIKEHNKALKIVRKINPLSIIFQSMTPHYSANIFFRKICTDFKIPFVTWIHGATGVTNSLLSYDTSDCRFSNNLISWGVHLEELLKSDTCILNKLKLQKDIKVFPVGSVQLDYNYRKYFLKKDLLKSSKPTVIYITGTLQIRNQFYFGYNREKADSLWIIDYEILKLLKRYQDRYNIIFKDYANGNANLWKKILIDINAQKISYISSEKNLNSLLNISDLTILSRLSTPFFEALYFDADIFVIDDDIFEKPFEQKLKDEIFYFKNMEKFKLKLEKYLETGKFYKCKKGESRKYFLNFDCYNNRNKLLRDVLLKVSSN